MTASDEIPDPGEWLEAPFEQVDPEAVVCRFDVSAVFDDDADDEEDDDDLESVLSPDADEDLEPLDADR